MFKHTHAARRKKRRPSKTINKDNSPALTRAHTHLLLHLARRGRRLVVLFVFRHRGLLVCDHARRQIAHAFTQRSILVDQSVGAHLDGFGRLVLVSRAILAARERHNLLLRVELLDQLRVLARLLGQRVLELHHVVGGRRHLELVPQLLVRLAVDVELGVQRANLPLQQSRVVGGRRVGLAHGGAERDRAARRDTN